MSFMIVGVDPSSKWSAVCRNGQVKPVASRSLKEDLVASGETAQGRDEGLVVLWDSPLSFARARGYSNRPIDMATSRVIKAEPQIESGAANALHFTGVTHWALTLDVLGLWLDGGRQGPPWSDTELRIVDRPEHLSTTSVNVVEVHPTVALCAWWMEKSNDTFRRYKRGQDVGTATRLKRCRRLWDVVGEGTPPTLETRYLAPDDVLDAWAAWKLGCDWLDGKAELVGSVTEGGYLLPQGRLAEAVKAQLAE